ncbi:tetracycline resistance MFS efflux pump [Calidithermus timidus]|jgi:DHA1 family tetracycline resistance protein-like MFS transporter|uniref:tetracycline resistance MFS efflux pump n=1 Tax=Calidithermus timidus TaxID=307124 RepID=UPI00037721FC|nr:tetracycline resistance MFS efflux pump [Calidithermus timidus]
MVRSGLLVVLAILFVDVAGEGLLYPITPSFLQALSGGSVQEAARLYGWSLALYAALTLFFAPVWGMLSDRYGRKPLLLLSMAGAAVGNLLTALAPGLELYFLGRAVAAVTSANLVVVNAYLVDISPPERRARNFGLLGAVFGVGFVIGPALGGLVGDWGLRVPFWIVAGSSAFTFTLALALLPESLKAENRKRTLCWLEANPFGALAALARYPLLRPLGWTILLSGLAMNMLVAVWIPYGAYRYGFGPTENGLILAAFGLMAALGQGLVVPWLVPRLGERRAVVLGLGVSALSLVLYGLASTPWVLFGALAISALGAVDEPALQAFISRNVRSDEQGTVQGALATIGNLMGVVGPVAGTYLFSRFTGPQAVAELPGAPFLAGAFCVALGLGIAYRTLRRFAPQPSR